MTNVRHAITFNNDAQAFIYVYEDFALEKALKKNRMLLRYAPYCFLGLLKRRIPYCLTLTSVTDDAFSSRPMKRQRDLSHLSYSRRPVSIPRICKLYSRNKGQVTLGGVLM